jgi:hypothetical protein
LARNIATTGSIATSRTCGNRAARRPCRHVGPQTDRHDRLMTAAGDEIARLTDPRGEHRFSAEYL